MISPALVQVFQKPDISSSMALPTRNTSKYVFNNSYSYILSLAWNGCFPAVTFMWLILVVYVFMELVFTQKTAGCYLWIETENFFFSTFPMNYKFGCKGPEAGSASPSHWFSRAFITSTLYAQIASALTKPFLFKRQVSVSLLCYEGYYCYEPYFCTTFIGPVQKGTLERFILSTFK